MSLLRNLLKPSILKSRTQFPFSSSTLYSSYCTSASVTPYVGLKPTKPDEKPRVVVLGSGWAGCRLIKEIDPNIYDVVCVSSRIHMVFTPLLASTCVGTLEFHSVAKLIGRIQPATSREPGSYYFLANFNSVDTKDHVTSTLEEKCALFSEELQRKCICPICHLDNSEALAELLQAMELN